MSRVNVFVLIGAEDRSPFITSSPDGNIPPVGNERKSCCAALTGHKCVAFKLKALKLKFSGGAFYSLMVFIKTMCNNFEIGVLLYNFVCLIRQIEE